MQNEYQENISESELQEKYRYFIKPPKKRSSSLFLYIFFGIFIFLMILGLQINSSYLYCFHRIKENDTIISISKKYYGTSSAYEKIFAANVSILKNNKDKLPVGKMIRIPLSKLSSKYVYIPHKVLAEDTIETLAQRYYGSINNISKIIVANLNILKKPEQLPIGKTIRIPMLRLSSDYLYLIHKVVKNDSIQHISQLYFGNTEKTIEILVANSEKIKNIDILPIGHNIRIPILKKNDYYYERYRVMPNDTFFTISEKYYKTPNEWAKIFIVNSKKLKNKNKLVVGDILTIPIPKK